MYVIRIRGHLDTAWASYLDGMTLENQPDGTSTIAGPVKDQAHLHSILTRIFGLGLTLISVNRGNETIS